MAPDGCLAGAAARQLSGESLKFNERLRGRAILVRDESGRVLQRVIVDMDSVQ
jgi:hypothetical protein